MNARRYAAALLAVATLLLAACADSGLAPPARRDGTVSLSASVAGTAVAGVSVEVTGPGIATPVLANLPVTGGVAAGTVAVPVGSGRVFTVRAYDALGIQTHQGAATVAVRPGQNGSVSVTLRPLAGDQPITVTIGTYAVTLSATAVALDVGQTRQLTATVTDVDGTVVANAALDWGSTNPVVASVDQAGLVTAGVAGTATVVASYGGVAAAAQVTVSAPAPPTLVVSRIYPTAAVAGGLVYVEGQGLANASVAFRPAGGQATVPGIIVSAAATRLTVQVPATLPTTVPVTIVVATASGTVEDQGKPVYVINSSAFGDALVPGKGLVGRVYALPANTAVLPDFGPMPVQSVILAPNLDVAARDFTEGFPGVPGGLFEWFGIRFDGVLLVPQSGTYGFGLESDDGARLYIDDQLIVNDDGIHPLQFASGSVALTAGPHRVRVDYFQGPRYKIGLRLHWTPPNLGGQIVPATAFDLPDLSLIFP